MQAAMKTGELEALISIAERNGLTVEDSGAHTKPPVIVTDEFDTWEEFSPEKRQQARELANKINQGFETLRNLGRRSTAESLETGKSVAEFKTLIAGRYKKWAGNKYQTLRRCERLYEFSQRPGISLIPDMTLTEAYEKAGFMKGEAEDETEQAEIGARRTRRSARNQRRSARNQRSVQLPEVEEVGEPENAFRLPSEDDVRRQAKAISDAELDSLEIAVIRRLEIIRDEQRARKPPSPPQQHRIELE
jgi:hypothetical protein